MPASTNPTPASSGRRPPLTFASNGAGTPKKELPKSSVAVNSILLGSKNKIVRQSAPQTTTNKLLVPGKVSKTIIYLFKHSRYNLQGASMKASTASHLRTLDSSISQDVDSPVFNYNPSTAVQKKLQPRVKSMTGNEPKKQAARTLDTKPTQKAAKKPPINSKAHVNSSPLCQISSPESVLSGASANGKHRQFNLSGVSSVYSKKSRLKGRKSKPTPKDVSLNSTCTSDVVEPSAIPDSLPAEPLRAPAKKPAATAKSRTKPVPVKHPRRRSFACESDDDLDQSWVPTSQETRNPNTMKEATHTTSRKMATDKKCKKTVATKNVCAAKTVPKPAMAFKSQVEKQQFMDDVYGDFSTPDEILTTRKDRKRVIDTVYDLNDANHEAPQLKVPKPTPVARKKPTKPPKKTQPPKRLSKPKPKNPPKTKQSKELEVVTNRKASKTVRKPLTEIYNAPAQHSKTYGSKNYQKRPEADNNAFDDLVFNYHRSTRHCSKQDKQSQNIPSSPLEPKVAPRVSNKSHSRNTAAKKLSSVPVVAPVMSPSKTSSSLEQSPPSFISEEVVISEELSVQESVRDQVMNTETTETANVPQPLVPPVQDPLLDVPPSPSISIHSSQITADLNITLGFHKICRALISKSGIDVLPQVATTSFQAQNFPDDCEELDEVNSTVSNMYNNPDYEEPEEITLTLTQLTRVSIPTYYWHYN